VGGGFWGGAFENSNQAVGKNYRRRAGDNHFSRKVPFREGRATTKNMWANLKRVGNSGGKGEKTAFGGGVVNVQERSK